MAIDSTTRKVVYEGNGSTTTFQFFFKVFDATDVSVQVGASGSTPSTLTYGTEFTAVLNADQTTNPGGTVTLTTAPATGVNVAVVSAIPETQPMVLTPYDGFNPETLNDSADRAVALVQQLSEKLERAITVDTTDTMSAQELKNKLLTAADTAYEVAMQYAAQAGEYAAKSEASAKEAVDTVTEAKAEFDKTAAEASESATSASESATSASESATSASTSASSASASATEASGSAELAKKWAISTDSPDDESDTDSATGKTQSSRSWALSVKADALAAQTSATSANNHAMTAQAYANSASASATRADRSATTASTKASEAAASAEAAQTAASEAEQALADADVTTVLRYTAQTLTDEQKTQARANIGVDNTPSGDYLPLSGGTMTGTIVSATNGNEIIRSGSTNSEVIIKGGTLYDTGASLWLCGADRTDDYAGSFALNTPGQTYQLLGLPSGTLRWNGGNINVRGLAFLTNDIFTSSSTGKKYNAAMVSRGGTSPYGALLRLHSADSNLDDAFTGGFELASRKSDGAVGPALIGLPGGTLTWNGTAFNAPTLHATSDARLKENIEEVSADLSAIGPKRYILKADKKKHVGLIAQDVLKICPEAVSKGEDGYYALDYNAIVALLVGEVNALKKEIKALKGE